MPIPAAANALIQPQPPHSNFYKMNPELDLFENFFSENESSGFLQELTHGIGWEQKTIKIFGRSVLEPRLTAWYGVPEAHYTYSGTRMQPRAWTKPLLKIKGRVESVCKTSFNSVLLNLYRNQNDSMGLHSDDEKELGEEPIIASVSFGATRRFVLKTRKSTPALKKVLLLKPGSLLIMRGKTQKLWKHGIPKETYVCEPRINLTFRTVFVR